MVHEELDRYAMGEGVAVLLPCHNEEAAVAGVIESFKHALPEATVYVYDNSSTDHTADVAMEAGAILRTEPSLGKGNVVRRMFSDVEADIYVLADGDGTYDADAAPEMIKRLIADNLDVVTGVRMETSDTDAYRRWHRSGNAMGNWLLKTLFGGGHSDIWSGYRVMSRRFVKSFPIVSRGFEIETEMTIHILQGRIPFAELETRYVERHPESTSKLRTWRDGSRILLAVALMLKEVHPIRFFSIIGSIAMLLAIGLTVPIVLHYLETGLVPRLPTFTLSIALGTLSALNFSIGIVLDSVARGRYETKRLEYQRYTSICADKLNYNTSAQAYKR